MGNRLAANKVYMNPGNGDFSSVTPVTIGSDSSRDDTRSIVITIIDELTYIITGNAGQRNRMYRVPSLASELPATQSLSIGGETDETLSVAVGDINADSAPDIVVTNVDRSSMVYLNSGTGAFTGVTPVVFGPGRSPVVSLGLADLDSNGFLDVIIGSQLYLNPGTGDLSNEAPLSFALLEELVTCIATSDLDGDVRRCTRPLNASTQHT